MFMIKGYIILSEAWYGEDSLKRDGRYVDEVSFGMYNREYDGGLTCKYGFSEVMMRWYELQGEVAPRLELFSDSFGNINALREVFSELNSWTHGFDVKDFCELLDELGFEDLTKRERN
jgi:hypothetical protein